MPQAPEGMIPARFLSTDELVRRVERKRAFIYIRVSLAREKMTSPKQQRWICEQHCAANNIEVVEIIVDDDHTGTEFAKRRIGEMIQRIKQGEANCIVVWEYSRFGRNLVGCRQHTEALERIGGQLFSATQNIDTTTSNGRFMRDHFFMMAEYQASQIGDGWKNVHARRRREGLSHTGRNQFGYRRGSCCKRNPDNKRSYLRCDTCKGVLQPDPRTASFFAQAYARYGNGEAANALAAESQKLGIVSVRGNPMDGEQLLQAMDSGFAAGLLRGRTNKKVPQKNARPDSYDIWDLGVHEAIIDPEVWMKYLERRLRQGDPQTRTRTPKHGLSGLVRCEEICADDAPCLAPMRAHHQHLAEGLVLSHVCNRRLDHKSGKWNRITMESALEEVLIWIRKIKDGSAAAQVSMERSAKVIKSEGEIEEARRERMKIARRLARLYDLYEQGEDEDDKPLIDKAEYRRRKKIIDADLAIVDARLRTLGEAVRVNKVADPLVFQGIEHVWADATDLERQQLLATVIDHIRVATSETGITFEIIPLWEEDESRRIGARMAERRRRRRDAALFGPDSVGDSASDLPEIEDTVALAG